MVTGYFIVVTLHPSVSPVVPLAMYFVLSFVVGNLYMNVFGLAVDTSLQCVVYAEKCGLTEEVCPYTLRKLLSAHAQKKVEDGGDMSTQVVEPSSTQ